MGNTPQRAAKFQESFTRPLSACPLLSWLSLELIRRKLAGRLRNQLLLGRQRCLDSLQVGIVYRRDGIDHVERHGARVNPFEMLGVTVGKGEVASPVMPGALCMSGCRRGQW